MTKKQKSRAGFLSLFFCFAVIAVNGQKYRAAVQSIGSPGFYKIILQPALIAKSEAGLTDLRLRDAKGKEVPYINSWDVPVNKGRQFMVFPKVEKGLQKDTGTNIVVENKAKAPVGRIWVKVKNTDVVRSMDITGSDDLENWFAITEHVPLEGPDLNNNGDYVLSIAFPPSNYHYLKILVNDKNKAPVNFLEAGIYIAPSLKDNYQSILPVKLTQYDSAKMSYITVDLDDKYQVNKIHLNIKGPKYFNRPVYIYDGGQKVALLIDDIELNSAKGSDILLSVKTNRLLLKIDNADNLPLAITAAQVYQANQYIVSYLEAGEYILVTGDANAKAPDYDLKFFKDSLRGFIPEVTHLDIVNNAGYHGVATKKVKSKLIIWLSIIVSLLLLSTLSFTMLREINRKPPA